MILLLGIVAIIVGVIFAQNGGVEKLSQKLGRIFDDKKPWVRVARGFARILFWIAVAVEVCFGLMIFLLCLDAYWHGTLVFHGEFDCLPEHIDAGWKALSYVFERHIDLVMYLLPCMVWQILYACVLDIVHGVQRKRRNKASDAKE